VRPADWRGTSDLAEPAHPDPVDIKPQLTSELGRMGHVAVGVADDRIHRDADD
jgi:hypothetical protein